jgi:hypothetical protein
MGAEAATIADDIEAVYAEADYQMNLPGVTEPLPQPAEEEEEPEEEPADDTLGKIIFFVLKWLSILAAAALVIYLAVSAYRGWRNLQRQPDRTDRQADDGSLEASDPAQGRASAFLAEAEAFARQGAYAEAIHALLLAVLEVMRQRTDHVLAPALTARELIGRVMLDEDRRRDFADLVASSERGHFGGRTADRSAFEASFECAHRLLDRMVRS